VIVLIIDRLLKGKLPHVRRRLVRRPDPLLRHDRRHGDRRRQRHCRLDEQEQGRVRSKGFTVGEKIVKSPITKKLPDVVDRRQPRVAGAGQEDLSLTTWRRS
jgi:hypothetical protein